LLLPKLAQAHGRIAADAEAEHRVVRGVKKGVQARQVARLGEAGQQVFAVAFQRVGPKVGFVPVLGQEQAATVRGAADPGAVYQGVVFNKAQKHAAQQPMHSCLGDDLVAPAVKGFRCALGIAGGLPFGGKAGFEVRQGVDAFTQVVF